jgi:translation initiation factor 2 alpha subunit (eIF-2alpha)
MNEVYESYSGILNSEDEFFLYSKKYPNIDDVVMVKIAKITAEAVYVNLLEYNNIEGMIKISEVSRKRFKSTKTLIKINEIVPMIVLNINTTHVTTYIDLSKRNISQEESEYCIERYNIGKKIYGIFKQSIIKSLCEKKIKYDKDIYQKFFNYTLGEIYEQMNIPQNVYDMMIKDSNNIIDIFDKNGINEIQDGLFDVFYNKIMEIILSILKTTTVVGKKYEIILNPIDLNFSHNSLIKIFRIVENKFNEINKDDYFQIELLHIASPNYQVNLNLISNDVLQSIDDISKFDNILKEINNNVIECFKEASIVNKFNFSIKQ